MKRELVETTLRCCPNFPGLPKFEVGLAIALGAEGTRKEGEEAVEILARVHSRHVERLGRDHAETLEAAGFLGMY